MRILKILLQQPKTAWYSRSPVAAGTPNSIELRYLGTAGFVIRHPDRTVVLDPYISRAGLFTLLTRPLLCDAPLLKRLIPHADDVLIGHAHHDHVLDAPLLCQQTGARLIGSRATMMIGRAAGLPESQLVETAGRNNIASGTWTIRGLPSVHGKALLGKIPLAGDITAPPPWPPKMTDLRHGLVLNWLVDTGGLKIAHIDSADFINAELAGQQADILCLCAVGRQHRPNYVQDAIRLLKPRWVVPCHWDSMLTHIEDTPDLLPQIDLLGLMQEIRDAGAEPLLVPILGSLHFAQPTAKADATA